jgi:hypothetical protein
MQGLQMQGESVYAAVRDDEGKDRFAGPAGPVYEYGVSQHDQMCDERGGQSEYEGRARAFQLNGCVEKNPGRAYGGDVLMLEEMIVRYCAPTLAGLKTGNLFNFTFENDGELQRQIDACVKFLNPKGVSIEVLRKRAEHALIYIYRPTKLAFDLSQRDVDDFLLANGYPCSKTGCYIEELKRRLSESESFPHEIGLFLSYPLFDVTAFIENKGRNFKYIGCWKIYADIDRAKQIFFKYDRCTRIYCRYFAKKKSILRLTVAA